jgi:lysophospholipase L1-like esterase
MTSDRRIWSLVVAGAASLCACLASDPLVEAQGFRSAEHWVGTWTTADVARDPHPPSPAPPPPVPGVANRQAQPPEPARPPLNFKNQTLRQIVHISVGSERVRVVVSNIFGTAPLAVGAAHVALRTKGAGIAPESDRALTFSGKSGTTVPSGAVAVSDSVNLPLPAFADLAIDLYLPGDTEATTSPLTMHGGAHQTNYVSSAGNHAGAPELPVQTTMTSWFFLARVEVTAPESVGAVVTLGDSITDGTASSLDENRRWPDRLARRLAAGHIKIGVLNAGIGGNRLLADNNNNDTNALARFDRDVLIQSGVTQLIVFEGTNDIRHTTPPVAADDLIAAHKQLIERAHTRGLTVFGGTVTPFEGSLWSRENETKRQALNEWIRTSTAYDGVIDFDAAVRDPSHPTQLKPQFDSGDHVHPNDAGYQAMADAVSLKLFETPRPSATVRAPIGVCCVNVACHSQRQRTSNVHRRNL